MIIMLGTMIPQQTFVGCGHGLRFQLLVHQMALHSSTYTHIHTHSHSSSHIVNTQLCTVSAHDTKVDSIEDQCDSNLDRRTHTQQRMDRFTRIVETLYKGTHLRGFWKLSFIGRLPFVGVQYTAMGCNEHFLEVILYIEHSRFHCLYSTSSTGCSVTLQAIQVTQ